MELDVQDWLIVIGALLIVGVLLDAYRRLRNERRNPIRLGTRKFGPGNGFPERDDIDPTVPELPMGGARVVVRDDTDAKEMPARPARREPRFDTSPAAAPAPAKTAASSRTGATTAQASLPSPPGPATVSPPRAAEPAPAPATAPAPSPGRTAVPSVGAASRVDGSPEEVVLIRVFARSENGLAGKDVLRIFKECDVRYGDRRIFHRHEEAKGQGAVQFSVANVVEPGTFDTEAMDDFTTPGLSFFMLLPGPQKPLEAFDCMLETARAIAKYLDGELRDESNSVFTQQTGEHCRQRIREYALRARTRR